MMYLVGRIAEKEEIKAEIAEIQAVVAQAAQHQEKQPKEIMDKFTEDGTINEITLNIVRNKVFDKLVEGSQVKRVKLEEEKPEGQANTKKKAKTKA